MRLRLLLACFLICGQTAPGEAADWYTGASTTKPDDLLVSADVSAAYTSNSSLFTDAIVTGAVNSTLNQSGARIRADGLAGSYDYPVKGQSAHVVGQQQEASLMGGYEVVWSDARIAGYAGVDVRNNRLSIADPHNPVVGTAYGVKAAIDAYANPTTYTMASLYASYASDHNAYYARARAGYAIWGNAFFGPEATVLGDDFFSQWRIGAHLSGVQFGPVQIGISAGYLNDRIQGSGIYTSVDARVAF